MKKKIIPLKTLPKSVRVGPHYVRFEELDKTAQQHSWAHWSELDQAIRLQPEFPSGSKVAETIIHEVLHAVFGISDLHTKHKAHEEEIVSVLATYVAQVIRDNPELMKWLQAAVNK